MNLKCAFSPQWGKSVYIMQIQYYGIISQRKKDVFYSFQWQTSVAKKILPFKLYTFPVKKLLSVYYLCSIMGHNK